MVSGRAPSVASSSAAGSGLCSSRISASMCSGPGSRPCGRRGGELLRVPRCTWTTGDSARASEASRGACSSVSSELLSVLCVHRQTDRPRPHAAQRADTFEPALGRCGQINARSLRVNVRERDAQSLTHVLPWSDSDSIFAVTGRKRDCNSGYGTGWWSDAGYRASVRRTIGVSDDGVPSMRRGVTGYPFGLSSRDEWLRGWVCAAPTRAKSVVLARRELGLG
jgi:hypothetical protein